MFTHNIELCFREDNAETGTLPQVHAAERHFRKQAKLRFDLEEAKINDVANDIARAKGTGKEGTLELNAERVRRQLIACTECFFEACALHTLDLRFGLANCFRERIYWLAGEEFSRLVNCYAPESAWGYILATNTTKEERRRCSVIQDQRKKETVERIDELIQRALDTDEAHRRIRMSKGNNVQNVWNMGGQNSITGTGDIYNAQDLSGLAIELSQTRSMLQMQASSGVNNELVKNVALAEQYASRNDASGVKHVLAGISSFGLNAIKSAVPKVGSQILLHFLKEHGLA